MNSRKTKLLVESDSSLIVFNRSDEPTSNVSETDGQYFVHLDRPRSIIVVTITINVLCASNTICQKSFTVFCKGPETRNVNKIFHFIQIAKNLYLQSH